MIFEPLPEPCWVELRMPISKRFIARFDPIRGILIVTERGEIQVFDLAEIVQEYKQKQVIPKP